jgi:uncharacterized protein YdeI (YjbR/CyaY-like superfamily)
MSSTAATKLPTLDVPTRAGWRAWLAKNHAKVQEVWLVFYKPHTGKKTFTYHDALDEALCYGWIDSKIRRLDEDRYALRFVPRKPDSKWSDVNRKRYAELAARGLLAAPGIERGPTANRYRKRTKRYTDVPPEYIERAFKANARAWAFFESLAPSYRRYYIGWIDSAKREETKQKRLREAVQTLAAGRKLGMK